MKKTLLFAMCMLASGMLFGKTVIVISAVSADGKLDAGLLADSASAKFSESDEITVVDREQLGKTLSELALSASDMASPAAACRTGRILGAKYFCSGAAKGNVMIVKLTDVETTAVKTSIVTLAATDTAMEAGAKFADAVASLIAKSEKNKKTETPQNAPEKPYPANWKLPVVMVLIPEMHVAKQRVIDPAAETEIVKIFLDRKFKVIDSAEAAKQLGNSPDVKVTVSDSSVVAAYLGKNDKKSVARFAAEQGADVLVYGEAFSEFGVGVGSFSGCRARLELKAVNVKDNTVILSTSGYGGASDLAENVAGKKAIQNAALKLGPVFARSLAEKWNPEKK